jgi:thiamine kinase-like enzyme
LVLDDLSSIGFKSVKFSEGLTYDQTKAALEAIANVHAHSLALKVVEGVSLPERYPFLFQTAKATDSYQQLVERGLPQLARFLKSRPGLEAVLETLLVLRPRTKDIISALLAPEGPLALITHTDFWSNNLFFSSGLPIQCWIIDWQMITYSRPTNDVALLLLSSVPTKLRRNHTESLLCAYWNKLDSICMDLGLNIFKELGYTWNDFNKDYRKSQLLALLLCIGSVDVALGDPRTEQRLIDVLEDLYNDGILTDETIVATSETNS